MKRLHIHVAVENLEQSIRFYSSLFGAGPSKAKDDYAKWMLDDPRVNFAISARGGKPGVDHLGVQVDEDSELEELRARLQQADMSVFDEGETVCCYARSEKSWVKDPSGIAWEAYKTMADAQLFSENVTAISDTTASPTDTAQPETATTPVSSAGCCG